MKAQWDNMPEWSLIKRSLRGELSEEQRGQVERWLAESPQHREYYDKMARFEPGFSAVDVPGEQVDEDYRRFMAAMRRFKRRRALRRAGAVAAVVVFAVGLAAWVRSGMGVDSGELKFTQREKEHPVLITGDGTRLDLLTDHDRLRKEMPAIAEGDAEGLVYDPGAYADPAADNIHTFYIPRGGVYNLTLTDGTRVWLNSDTELSYHVGFPGANREVSLRGEAYFEVAKGEKPFVVRAAGAEITAYGTQFNVSTYQPGVIQTVLVTGRVGICAVDSPADERMLRPGELAEINPSTGDFLMRRVDIGSYVAWKDGYFSFDSETIEQIMDKLGRWYDFDVVYLNDEVRTRRFSGHISRDHDLAGILETIQRTALVTFGISGNTITIR